MNWLASIIGQTGITTQSFLACALAALILGLVIALTYMRQKVYSQGFVITLVLLPLVVQVVIMLVNGNVGTGVAVAGAFSLVRFRSLPGTAKDICSIFIAMAVGLACGMGYVGLAVIFTVIVCMTMFLLEHFQFGGRHQKEKELLITIPESLDYSDIFDDLFETYTSKAELVSVKTTNMGSLFKLRYALLLKDEKQEKELIDALRCRNGNLEISCGRAVTQEQLL